MKTMSYTQVRSPTWRDIPIDLISRSPIARWAPIPLRLIVGYGFMEHGFAKLARGLDAFPAILQALGVPAPHLMGWLTIFVEIVGGLAVLLGALVPFASIPMAAVLLVAMFTVHLPGWAILSPGETLRPPERRRGVAAGAREAPPGQARRGVSGAAPASRSGSRQRALPRLPKRGRPKGRAMRSTRSATAQ